MAVQWAAGTVPAYWECEWWDPATETPPPYHRDQVSGIYRADMFPYAYPHHLWFRVRGFWPAGFGPWSAWTELFPP